MTALCRQCSLYVVAMSLLRAFHSAAYRKQSVIQWAPIMVHPIDSSSSSSTEHTSNVSSYQCATGIRGHRHTHRPLTTTAPNHYTPHQPEWNERHCCGQAVAIVRTDLLRQQCCNIRWFSFSWDGFIAAILFFVSDICRSLYVCTFLCLFCIMFVLWAVFELSGGLGGVEPPSSSSNPPSSCLCQGLGGVSRNPPALASTLNIFTTDMFLQYVQTWTSMKSIYARRPLPRLI